MTLNEAIEVYCKALDTAYETYFHHSTSSMAQYIDIKHEPCEGGKAYIRIARREYKKGTKVVNTSSAVAFVKVDDGSIWKPASWKAPAKNFSRGNVYDLPTQVAWSL
jgi:hypothetical protein